MYLHNTEIISNGERKNLICRLASFSSHSFLILINTQILLFTGVLKELKIQNIKNKFEAEEQAAHQHYEVCHIFNEHLLADVFIFNNINNWVYNTNVWRHHILPNAP